MVRQSQAEDWYCTACADLQFGHNTSCRRCGQLKEDGVKELSVDMFLAGHDIRKEIEDDFRQLSPDLQKVIMDRGTLKQARDPTAVLVKRMANLQCGRPGDWWCAQCCDLQFAKNATCRSCGAARDDAAGPMEFPDPEMFLQGHEVEDNVRQEFLALDAGLQRVIIMRGSLHGANNPSSVLKSRISQVYQDGSGACGMKGGKMGGKEGGKGKDMMMMMMSKGWDVMMGKGWGKDPWSMKGKGDSDPWGMNGKGGKGWGNSWDSWDGKGGGGSWDSWGGYGPWGGKGKEGKHSWGDPYGGKGKKGVKAW